MRRSLLVLSVLLIAGLVSAWAALNAQDSSDKSKTDDYKISDADIARVNPVKSSPEGLAEARKVFGYDCEMCHGAKGDGKGDVVESMKLTMRDWRDAATLAKLSDGEIFYIITKGKGKMMAEGERVPEKLRWNLVNLVRALAAKGGEQKSTATAAAPSR
ncbi:MAG TPA: cytochrome c [Candidatus Saccharimonadales bacterium]|jgi:cytochrome c5|nr:cytochrome c [Candidatus Saccharimonadales bacterium]